MLSYELEQKKYNDFLNLLADTWTNYKPHIETWDDYLRKIKYKFDENQFEFTNNNFI